jgi:hypothetical protein
MKDFSPYSYFEYCASYMQMESIAADTGSGGSVGSAMSDRSDNIEAILPPSSPAEGDDRRAG